MRGCEGGRRDAKLVVAELGAQAALQMQVEEVRKEVRGQVWVGGRPGARGEGEGKDVPVAEVPSGSPSIGQGVEQGEHVCFKWKGEGREGCL